MYLVGPSFKLPRFEVTDSTYVSRFEDFSQQNHSRTMVHLLDPGRSVHVKGKPVYNELNLYRLDPNPHILLFVFIPFE